MKKLILGILSLATMYIYAQNAVNIDNIQNVQNVMEQYSGDIETGSARYIGMGGSMGALGGDISSSDVNPAGIGVLISPNVSGTMGVVSKNNKTNFGSSLSSRDSEFSFNQIGGAFVIKGGDDWKYINIAFNYNRQETDNNIDIAGNNNIYWFNSSETYTMTGYSNLKNGFKEKYSMTIGANYSDLIYLGLSLNAHNSEIGQEELYFDKNSLGTRYSYERNLGTYNEQASGFSLGVGIIGKISQNIRAGFAYHSPVWWGNVETEYIFYEDTDGNGLYDAYGLGLYDKTTYAGAQKISLSLAGVFAKKISINADYLHHFNKSAQINPSSAYWQENDLMKNYIKDSDEFRLGAEFRLNKFRIRAGYGLVTSPIEDIITNKTSETGVFQTNESVKDLYMGAKNNFSFGLGYDFGTFYLDFAYRLQVTEYQTAITGDWIDRTDYTNIFFNSTRNIKIESLEDNGFYPIVTKVEGITNNFLLTFGWNF